MNSEVLVCLENCDICPNYFKCDKTVECYECKSEILKKHAYRLDIWNSYLCEDCAKKYYLICKFCRKAFESWQRITVLGSGECICEKCKEEHLFRCEKCREYFEFHEVVFVEKFYCIDCYKEKYNVNSDMYCGMIDFGRCKYYGKCIGGWNCHRNDIWDVYGARYKTSIWEPKRIGENNSIPIRVELKVDICEYEYKLNPKIHEKVKFLLEMSKKYPNTKYGKIKHVLMQSLVVELSRVLKDNAYYRVNDYLSEYGIEIVSVPCSVEYHKKNINWKEAFELIEKYGYTVPKEYEINGPSLVLSLNREDVDVEKLKKYFKENWEKIGKTVELNSKQFGPRSITVLKDIVELKMFRGTLDIEKFYKVLETVSEIAEYTKRE